MALVDPALEPTSYWEFQAEILVLHHQTTLSGKFQAENPRTPPVTSPPREWRVFAVCPSLLIRTPPLPSPPCFPPLPVGYAPIMHCGVVSQSARITTIRSLSGEDIPALRTGDRAIICCR